MSNKIRPELIGLCIVSKFELYISIYKKKRNQFSLVTVGNLPNLFNRLFFFFKAKHILYNV